MAQLELPAPVLRLIVSKIVESDSSKSWKTLRLVCKTLCARAGYFAKQLRLEVDEDLLRKARRCMELGFEVDHLHLVFTASSTAAQYAQSADQTAVLLCLFQLPLWGHLRTLRVSGVDLPEAVLSILPQVCPNLQELFLEGVVLDNSTTCSISHSGMQQPQQQPEFDVPEACPAQELPSVAVCLPRQVDTHAYQVQLCTISSCSKGCSNGSGRGSTADSINSARLAHMLSRIRRLQLLRMNCPLAESVMRSLCDIHQRPCLQDKRGSMCAFVQGSQCTPEQPLLEYIPLLGWYLFNVTGAPCTASSSSSSSSRTESITSSRANSAPSSSSVEQQSSAVACEHGNTKVEMSASDSCAGSPNGSSDGAVLSSSCAVGISSSSSCPPSASNSSNHLATINDGSAAAAAPLSNQLMENKQSEPQIGCDDEDILTTCAITAGLSRNNSVGRHSLDINQQQRIKANPTFDAAAALYVSDSCTCSGSSAASCCNLGQADPDAHDLCSCKRACLCSAHCVQDVCNSSAPCSSSALAPCKAHQHGGDANVRDALNNSVCGAADLDTGGVCSDQQLL